MGAVLAITAAVAAAGSTAYSITETKKQQKKNNQKVKEAKKAEEQKIQERNDKIAGMKSRLFSTEQGLYGEETKDNKIIGN